MAHFRSAEKIPADRRTRRRLEWEDTRRPAWVMWLSVVCLVALAAAVVALANTDRMSRPTAVNGDVLGPQNGETVDSYIVRAGQTLAEDGDGRPRWALVSPESPADVAALTALFTGDPELRVSTLLSGGVQWPVPEPSVGHRREDVFTAVRHRVALSAGIPDNDEAMRITGIVVRGTTGQLRTLASAPGVRAVEALPGDAVYGRFGMRPLDDTAPQPAATQVPEAPEAATPEAPAETSPPPQSEVPAL